MAGGPKEPTGSTIKCKADAYELYMKLQQEKEDRQMNPRNLMANQYSYSNE